MKRKSKEIRIYDEHDTADWIDPDNKLSLKDLGLKIPPVPPTQVISIRLPTRIINELRARASSQDIPYQSLIKIFLARSLGHKNI